MEPRTISLHNHGQRYGQGAARFNEICRYWLKGCCYRSPCPYLHGTYSPSNVYRQSKKQSNVLPEDGMRKCPKYGPRRASKSSDAPLIGSLKCGPNMLALTPGISHDAANPGTVAKELPRKHVLNENPSTLGRGDVDKRTGKCSGSITSSLKKNKLCSVDLSASTEGGAELKEENHPCACSNISTLDGGTVVSEVNTSQSKVCEFWMSGSCVKGDSCQFLHSWFCGSSLLMLAKLKGHSQAITGIALPSGSDKLYSGSNDGTVHVWDCYTGQTAKVMNLGCQIGSLISVGPWVFVGMPGVVKASNIETAADFSLNGPVGQVHAMTVALDMLFAGSQDGAISVWKGSTETPEPFQLATLLKGHNGAVKCLKVGDYKLFSGSMDGTIKVWDLNTLQCTQTLSEHKNPVTDLICWNGYLLSSSLDQTIKVRRFTEGGKLEVVYTHDEGHGICALCGIYDAEEKSILYCSCDDNIVRLYELPSFRERGRIFSKREVGTIKEGPGGLFFTGDGSGDLTVWKLTGSSCRSS